MVKHYFKRGFAFALALVLTLAMFGVSARAYGNDTGRTDIKSFDATVSGDILTLEFEGNSWWFELSPVQFSGSDGTTEGKIIVGNDSVELYKHVYIQHEYYTEEQWVKVSTGSLTRDGEHYTVSLDIPLSKIGSGISTMNLCGISVGIPVSASTSTPAGDPADQPGNTPADDPANTSTDDPTQSIDVPNVDSADEPADDTNADGADETIDVPNVGVDDEPADEVGSTLTESQAAAQPAALTPNVIGRITVDGDDYDWQSVTGMAPGDNKVTEWKVARDTSGNVYLCFTGWAVSQWDEEAKWKNIYITQNGQTQNPQIASLPQTAGAELKIGNQANGNSSAPFCIEVMIPASYFTDPAFTLTFGNNSIAAANIPVLDGTAVQSSGSSYSGITIDGSFRDWDAVQKYPANDPNANGSNLSSAAMVYDKDTVFIYLEETLGGSATGAGSHNNGVYCITTDLGNMMLFELRDRENVNGPAGASARHVGRYWEIKIPASDLPVYSQTISFGLYMEQPMVTNVANLSPEAPKGSFTGAVIDGNYDDWKFFDDVRLIEYANQGNQSIRPDSHGSLYTDGTTVYGHVFTNMPAHLQEKGGEFLAAISIAFNGDREYKSLPELGNFYPKVIDENGNVLNDGTRLSAGTYHFFISDTRSTVPMSDPSFWSTQVFGDMYVTIRDDQGGDQMEFQLDLAKIAAYTGQDATDFKLVEAQFAKLGQEWLSAGGSSSGPWLGVGLCCSTVAGAWFYRKKKEEAAE